MQIIGQGNPATLIIAPPGRWRDGLQALVRATPQSGTTVRVDEKLTPSCASADCSPTLVLLNKDIQNDEMQSALQKIKKKNPKVHCILLANGDQKAQRSHDDDADLGKGSAGPTLLRCCLAPTQRP